MGFSVFTRKAHPELNDIPIVFDTDFSPPLTLLYVGADGNLELLLEKETASRVYPGVPAGTWVSLPIRQIVSAGTVGVVTDFVGHR